MEKQLSKRWWLMLIVGVAYTALGVIVWRYPEQTILGATLYIGITLLTTGFSYIGLAFGGVEKRGWYLLAGVVDVVVATLILFNPITSASMLVLTVGLWFVFKGIMLAVESFSLKKSGYGLWWLNLIGGIIITVLGWNIAGDPLAGSTAVVAYVSYTLWVKGILMITNAFGLKNLAKDQPEVQASS